MKTLLIAEHDNQSLADATLNTLTAALAVGQPVDVLVIGHDCSGVAEQAAGMKGIAAVLLADDQAFAHFLPEAIGPAIAGMASEYSHIMAAASTTGKNFMPCLAALLDVAQVSDISGVESATTFLRPVFAGNAISRVRSDEEKLVVTVRSSAFEAAQSDSEKAAVRAVDLSVSSHGTHFVSEKHTVSERPELGGARRVVSGGRGLGSAENFALVESLADKLGAAIGASRAAVDAGYVPNDLQVGQTGKIVAPELYIAVGISGAIQHLAGMKDSKVIVAINKDAEAPIFQAADYGIVGDLFTLVPELEKLL